MSNKADELLVPVSIAMSPDLAHRVRIAAAEANVSRSKWVRDVLQRALAVPAIGMAADDVARTIQALGS
jgi:hypothetical protein